MPSNENKTNFNRTVLLDHKFAVLSAKPNEITEIKIYNDENRNQEFGIYV